MIASMIAIALTLSVNSSAQPWFTPTRPLVQPLHDRHDAKDWLWLGSHVVTRFRVKQRAIGWVGNETGMANFPGMGVAAQI